MYSFSLYDEVVPNDQKYVDHLIIFGKFLIHYRLLSSISSVHGIHICSLTDYWKLHSLCENLYIFQTVTIRRSRQILCYTRIEQYCCSWIGSFQLNTLMPIWYSKQLILSSKEKFTKKAVEIVLQNNVTLKLTFSREPIKVVRTNQIFLYKNYSLFNTC